jgi:hypothetical protein
VATHATSRNAPAVMASLTASRSCGHLADDVMVGVSPSRRKVVIQRGLVHCNLAENFAKVGCGSLPQPGAFRKKERATLFAEFPSTLVARYEEQSKR